MTTRFRLDAVLLDTTEGQVSYRFPSALTVLAGPTGVGKTTLLELIKHALCGSGKLAPVAKRDVNDVTVEITIGAERYRIARSLDPKKAKNIRVTDLVTRERLPDHHSGEEQPSLNTLLLTALGLPDDLKAAARGNSSKPGARITFADIYSFLYVPQSQINRDIAHSQETYRAPKRKTVFELLFGMTSPELAQSRSRVNTLRGEIAQAEQRHEAVLDFLDASGITSRADTEQALQTTEQEQRRAEAERDALRDEIDPVIDRATQTLRDLLTQAEQRLAEAQSTVMQLVRQQGQYTRERRRIEADLARLARMRDAGQRLASIEFSVCPRCTQSLTHREVPQGACRVCLQPDPGVETGDDESYEAGQLKDQLAEIDHQLHLIAKQLEATAQAVTERERLVVRLTADIDQRTATRVTPRLQAFSDATDRLATARAQHQALQEVLRQWDQADVLQATAEGLRTERDRLQQDISRIETQLEDRRREVLSSLEEEFQAAHRALRIPSVETVAIDPGSYLPLLDGQPFDQASSAGGIITITQIAYWTSVIRVAMSLRDTLYPGFMLIDSPRLAVGDDDQDLIEAIYRSLVTQADADSDRLQFIIADHELPPSYRRSYEEIKFDYAHPTVATVRHPGRAEVQTLTEAEENDSSSS